MEILMIVPEWIGSEAAVPYYFLGDALVRLRAMVGEHLRIGMTMNIDGSRCCGQPGTIYCPGRFRLRNIADFGNDSVAHQNVAGTRRLAGPSIIVAFRMRTNFDFRGAPRPGSMPVSEMLDSEGF